MCEVLRGVCVCEVLRCVMCVCEVLRCVMCVCVRC